MSRGSVLCKFNLIVIFSGTFIALGLSGVIPAMHYTITDGIDDPVNLAALGWLILMAVLYISGAIIYAVRIPERIWPGKFDIWVSVVVICCVSVKILAYMIPARECLA